MIMQFNKVHKFWRDLNYLQTLVMNKEDRVEMISFRFVNNG